AVLLGHGHLVDPAPARARLLASRAAGRADRLRPPVLVAGVSPRHVLGRDLHPGEGHRPHAPRPDSGRRRVPRAARVAPHLRWDPACAGPGVVRWRAVRARPIGLNGETCDDVARIAEISADPSWPMAGAFSGRAETAVPPAAALP